MTKLYLRATAASNHRSISRRNGAREATLAGADTYWNPRALTPWAPPAGNTPVLVYAVPVNGPTPGIEFVPTGGSTQSIEYVTPGLMAGVTISGTITLNLWSYQSSDADNSAINVIIERVGPTGTVISTIAQTSRTTELSKTSLELANFTVTPTSTTMAKGDRIRIRPYIDDAGTMVAGGTAYLSANSSTADIAGDTWVEFTETLTFPYDSINADGSYDDPAGARLYLTDTDGPAIGSAVERELWTSRGTGVQSDVVSTVTGPTSPIQWTDTAGGSVVEWYTKPLLAFTLVGHVECWIRLSESEVSANAGVRAELAVCDGDGANAVVWSAGNTLGVGSELTTAETAYLVLLVGPDTPVTAGQRLLFRVYLDDCEVSLTTGYSATLFYAGTTEGASGDSYLLLASQSLIENGQQVVLPDADTTTTGWTSTPLWSKVDDPWSSPDGTVISATAS